MCCGSGRRCCWRWRRWRSPSICAGDATAAKPGPRRSIRPSASASPSCSRKTADAARDRARRDDDPRRGDGHPAAGEGSETGARAQPVRPRRLSRPAARAGARRGARPHRPARGGNGPARDRAAPARGRTAGGARRRRAGQPGARRDARGPERALAAANGHTDLEKTAAALAERVKSTPDNDEDWLLLARTEAALGHWQKSADAYGAAMRLTHDRPDIAASYGEMLVAAAQGIVTPRAHDLFAAAVERDPGNVLARYYLALGAAQAGDAQAA